MNDFRNFKERKKTFELLLEADRKLWEAVLVIQDSNAKDLYELIDPIMCIRGNIHIDLMRPIYKRHPKLAEQAGFGESNTDDESGC